MSFVVTVSTQRMGGRYTTQERRVERRHSFIELAAREDVPFATSDLRLRRAAIDAGIGILE